MKGRFADVMATHIGPTTGDRYSTIDQMAIRIRATCEPITSDGPYKVPFEQEFARLQQSWKASEEFWLCVRKSAERT